MSRRLNCHITPSPSQSESCSLSHVKQAASFQNISSFYKSCFYTRSQPFKIKRPPQLLQHSSSLPSHTTRTFVKALTAETFPPAAGPQIDDSSSPASFTPFIFLDISPLMDGVCLRCCGDDLDMFPPDSGVLALTQAPYVLFTQRRPFHQLPLWSFVAAGGS